jgi:hypothetical protein
MRFVKGTFLCGDVFKETFCIEMFSVCIVTEVGTCYFFRSLFPLIRYLEIVLPLRAGPQLSKI